MLLAPPALLVLAAGTWRDGRAEKCVYEATRTIYGVERRYLAIAYTDLERADPRSTVKVEEGEGVEVFKHHGSEIVPTERYDYRFSTMSLLRAGDLSPFKLTASTQEDCGASFKEVWDDRGRLRWAESVYFPGGGRREGEIERSGRTALFDALTLRLRDFPFDAPGEAPEDLHLSVVPSQKDNRRASFEPAPRTARYAGRSTQALPIGEVDAHQVDLLRPDGTVEARFWFAAEDSAPTLRALVRCEAPDGVTYKLKSLERTAYWER